LLEFHIFLSSTAVAMSEKFERRYFIFGLVMIAFALFFKPKQLSLLRLLLLLVLNKW